MKLRDFDPANYLDTREAIDTYVAEAIKIGKPAMIDDAIMALLKLIKRDMDATRADLDEILGRKK